MARGCEIIHYYFFTGARHPPDNSFAKWNPAPNRFAAAPCFRLNHHFFLRVIQYADSDVVVVQSIFEISAMRASISSGLRVEIAFLDIAFSKVRWRDFVCSP